MVTALCVAPAAFAQPVATTVGPASSLSTDNATAARALYEQYLSETALAEGYRRHKQPERVAAHAQAAFDAARRLSAATPLDGAARRDELLYTSAASLSDAYLEMRRTAEAINALQELRRFSVRLPSADLYRRASILLERIVPAVGLMIAPTDRMLTGNHLAPEISAEDWVGQQPALLAGLRGRVVLLDFWAVSCAPCRAALPHLKRWQQEYQRRGLTVVAFTQYERGRDRREQLSELKRLRRAWRLPFGFAIAGDYKTAQGYGVNTIPAAALIDRRGVVRYLSVGAKETDLAELEQLIVQLLDEPGS